MKQRENEGDPSTPLRSAQDDTQGAAESEGDPSTTLRHTQGFRPIFTENKHTGLFSGRENPQDDTGGAMATAQRETEGDPSTTPDGSAQDDTRRA